MHFEARRLMSMSHLIVIVMNKTSFVKNLQLHVMIFYLRIFVYMFMVWCNLDVTLYIYNPSHNCYWKYIWCTTIIIIYLIEYVLSRIILIVKTRFLKITWASCADWDINERSLKYNRSWLRIMEIVKCKVKVH